MLNIEASVHFLILAIVASIRLMAFKLNVINLHLVEINFSFSGGF